MIGRLFRKLVSPKTESPQEAPNPPVVISPAERKQRLGKAGDALAAGDYDQTHKLIMPVLQAHPDDGDALAIEGIRCYLIQSYEQAAAVLEHAIVCGALDLRAHEFLISSLINSGQDAAALSAITRAKHLLPEAQVRHFLGILYFRLERFSDAADLFSQAVAASPKDYASLVSLAQLDYRARISLRRSAFSEKAEQVRKSVLRKLLADRAKRVLKEDEAQTLIAITMNDPQYFQVAYAESERLYQQHDISDDTAGVVADVFMRSGDISRSLEMRGQLIELSKDDEGLNFAQGFTLVAEGGSGWFAGWQMMDRGVQRFFRSQIVSKIPLWQGERLGSGVLFINQDQGVGDLLMSLRLVRAYVKRGGKSVFWVRPALKSLIATAEGLGPIVTNEGTPDPQAHQCVAGAPVFSLVRLLKLKPKDLKEPVLIKAPQDRCVTWRERLTKEKRVRIGVAVQGNPWRADDWFRSVSPKALECLKAFGDVTWINLAVDDRPERDEMISMLQMLDPTQDIQDFSDAAAIVDMLDAVVAIDCSVAHLAGALGKPVFVLTPSTVEWRWKIGDDEQPWWPSARTFRSPEPGHWEQPVADLQKALGNFLSDLNRTRSAG